MSPNTTPADATAAGASRTPQPHSAAEHCAAAEALFARARELHPAMNGRADDQHEYRRCMEWAQMHLHFADTITAGANLTATDLRLKADGLRKLDFRAASEAYDWNTFLGERHDQRRRPE